MADTHPIDSPSPFAYRAAVSRGVGDDMAAIFGAERRAAIATPAISSRRPRRSRLVMGVLVAGGLTAVVGAGLLAGGSVVGLPASAAPDSRAPTVRRAAAPPPTFAVAGPLAPVSASVPAAVNPPPTPFQPAPGAAVPAVRPVAPVATATVIARPPLEQRATPGPPPADCDSDGSCIDGQLEAAERDIADAYAEATNAGVRARILRGYRNEWLRARDQADGRPREALRLYAMMTADLHNLSEDAVAAGRPDWR